ncbi:TOBE domain-containing protein [Marinospirillum minutulum]|uniref:TOBE domain-containing protein n=1 Tax=Marinospirillum minutulum TaxID=64974 RepID=UPI0003F66654|nr:TOBE domain-containing protein [Marinospirillum minutulum]
MKHPYSERFFSHLSLENDAGAALSSKRIRLLEMIGELGSIAQAAKAVPLSYKAAWDTVELLNSTAAQPLVERTSGGRQGGGTRLTEYGRRMTVMYRALEQEHQATLDRLLASMDSLQKGDLKDFQQLMYRTAIKTSARNNFFGVVTGLRDQGINYLVHLDITPNVSLVVQITKTSADNLSLVMGQEVFALFKAFSLELSCEAEPANELVNQLWGRVKEINLSREQVEVVVELADKQKLVALISQQKYEELALKLDTKVCASFAAEQIILASYN